MQILPANRTRQSFGEKLTQGIGTGLDIASRLSQQYQQKKAMNQENESLKKMGMDLSGIQDPNLRKLFIENNLKSLNEEASYLRKLEETKDKFQNTYEQKAIENKILQDQKTKEKIAPLKAGLETIQQMKDIGARGNLGRGSSFFSMFGGKTAEDYGKYEQLGKSLISLSSNIPIRNKAEFEALAHNLYDPSVPDSQRKGILDAMEEIVKRNMKTYQDEENYDETELDELEEEKILDSKAMEKIYELSKGNKDEARRIAKKMGYKI